MKKVSLFLLGVVICLLAVGVAYIWATAMMDSVYAYRSPLSKTPPTPGEGINKPLSRSVVVVLIDGLRYDTSIDPIVMPYLNQLRSIGADALMHSRPPSYSEPGYAVLLTGAWPDLSDAPLINVDYADIPTFTQDDIFSAARRAGLNTAVSGFNWFEKLIPQTSVTASFYTAGEDQVADRAVTDAALPWLKAGDIQLILIHLDQVDYAGHHEGGPADPRWNQAASRADALLKEIASAIDLSQDTLLVISDHGHIHQGGHGGQEPDILLEPFVLAGKNVEPGNYGDVQMVDVAPTLAVLLGTNIPATNQGQPHIDMLDLSLSQVDVINQALASQQGQLATMYGDSINHAVSISNTGDVVKDTQAGMDAARNERLNSERLPRAIIGIIVIIILLNFAAWHTKEYLGWIILSIITYLVIFNIKYVFLDHKTYSLSSVSDAMSLISSTGLSVVIALFISWILFVIGSRVYQLKPFYAADATLKFILSTLAVLAIPIVVHYIINGPVVTWALPNFLINFLGLLYLIQVLFVAVIGLFLTGISAVIGVFGHKKAIVRSDDGFKPEYKSTLP